MFQLMRIILIFQPLFQIVCELIQVDHYNDLVKPIFIQHSHHYSNIELWYLRCYYYIGMLNCVAICFCYLKNFI